MIVDDGDALIFCPPADLSDEALQLIKDTASNYLDAACRALLAGDAMPNWWSLVGVKGTCPTWCESDHSNDKPSGDYFHERWLIDDPGVGKVGLCVYVCSENGPGKPYVDYDLDPVRPDAFDGPGLTDPEVARRIGAAFFEAAGLIGGER